MSLTVACLARNEMRRFWPRILDVWAEFADEILVLDDGSDDGTREHAQEFGATVYDRSETERAWGNEGGARRQLFETAWNTTRIGDYVLVLDADMIPARSPRLLTDTGAEGLLFPLYELWYVDAERMWYRDDTMWRAHHTPRVWGVKKTTTPSTNFRWSYRGVHCGHLPMNITFDTFAYAPRDYSILHYAYATEELREEKYVEYTSVVHSLTDHERLHAISILDEDPTLDQLPFKPELAL